MARKAARPTVVLNVVGLVLLVLGWMAVSGKVTLSDQAPYLNIAVAGLLLAGVGNALYLMAARRTLEARLARVHDRIDSGVAGL
jgi:protein-S-isoprenylcysteine O-methyltransferase Ste14